MAENYILLERTELNASASSVTFSNIPQTGYTDLKIVASTRWSNAGPDGFYISFNGSTASFTSKVLEGSGSAATSASPARLAGGLEGTGYTANTFGSSEIYIPNYTSSNFKSYSADAVTENNATQAFSQLIAGLWSSTAAITSVGLAPTTGSFVAGSTFSLYGIAAVGTTPVIAPKASGGNRIDNDGTYWYHTFTSSGSFTPLQGISCDVLVVAGGGGGGGTDGGGGGAGGLIYFGSQVVSTLQNITVGAGGAGGAAYNIGTSGTDSTFASLTAGKGGGRGGGGSGPVVAGTAGGSGGGGAGNTGGGGGAAGSATQTGTGAISFYGNAGGTGAASDPPRLGAGGGGAGGAGGNGLGAGGAGVNSITGTTLSSWLTATSTGVSGYLAGGGGGGSQSSGGGAGGSGGGGAGASGANGSSATVNSGSGGGGGGNDQGGGAGGSGIVIIRYTIA